MWELSGDVGTNGSLKRDDLVQDTKNTLALVGSGKELGTNPGKIEAELERVRRYCDAKIVIGQEEPSRLVGSRPISVEKPRG